MNERYSPHRPLDVRRQSSTQYENIWHGYADARRALYPYEVEPGENRQPYNIWEDMADHLDPQNATKIIDIGTNDGYFHSILRHKGFKGEFIGIDIEGKDLPAVEAIAHHRFPGYNTQFIKGDAQNLKGVIETSSTPRAVAGFLPYHVPKPSKIFSEMHRILEPGGVGEVSTRDIKNQLDTWIMTRIVAHSHGYAFPLESPRPGQFIKNVPIEKITVYSHFGIEQTRASLSGSRRFRLLYEAVQDKDLWITGDEVGFFDYSRAVESLLPYTVKIATGQRPNDEDLQEMHYFIDTSLRNYFLENAAQNQVKYGLDQPYYKSHVSQAFFVVEAIK